MYVSLSCYIVQRFFKHYVTDDDVRNIETCLLGPVHTSHFCRVEFNSIKCGRNATTDSYVEFLPNLIR